ncbi:MAG: HD-GYP domain-containing protein [Methylotenera sp.]|uniref:HD-GYP domain-containing protein n=1 Tax=Methylotenera sp. TaxID=2051956 RepID=UPI00248750A0|nr:HD-GYP domain-containing protein [Methylotenera sp.]MDI1310368.1 HD-GYP domain-containing protein [Methylotenera sp.]
MHKVHHFIDVSQLQVGIYVHLDLGWMDHPFTLSNFKIKDEEQISQIKKTGLTRLRYDPSRSDCEPLPVKIESPVDEIINQETPAIPEPVSSADRAKQRLKELHHAINVCEKKFIKTSNIARQVTHNILSDSKASIEQALSIINDMVDTALMEGDVAVHALNGNRSSDAHYIHPLNVTVLALIMAKSINMSKEDARLLGLAALFHDIGKAEISDKILLKKDPLTKSEQSHLEQHSEIGARMAQEVGLPLRTGKIIMQHHEHADGTGYPKHLKGEQTDPFARLLAIVNGYDNLCNPNNIALAKTPYEALAHMYASQRARYDEALLKGLIKSLGIYPPGSIVRLSTGSYATVISVNPNKPLRPFVMVHDPLTVQHEPQIIDLREEPSITINACLRPSQLPAEVLEYLNPRKRVSYFIDADLSISED